MIASFARVLPAAQSLNGWLRRLVCLQNHEAVMIILSDTSDIFAEFLIHPYIVELAAVPAA